MWVAMSSGAKIWVLLRPKEQDSKAVVTALAFVSNLPVHDDPRKLEQCFDVSSILIEPGTVL